MQPANGILLKIRIVLDGLRGETNIAESCRREEIEVMYLGRFCELTSSARLYEAPLHPYTAALMAAIPVMDPDRPTDPSRLLSGELPSPMNPPSGCRFRTRCPRAAARCAELEPEWREAEPGHFVACHFPLA